MDRRSFLRLLGGAALTPTLAGALGGTGLHQAAASTLAGKGTGRAKRPVKLGFIALKDAPKAAVFVIFVTALWPIVVNTAAGAASVPSDQRNVARVFRFGRLAYLRHVVVPHTVPSTITGLRLSMGVAWMVIVAVEMLSGGSGIGFFVWDSYNGGNLAAVIAAIVFIGLVGVALDSAFVWLGRRFAPEEAPR